MVWKTSHISYTSTLSIPEAPPPIMKLYRGVACFRFSSAEERSVSVSALQGNGLIPCQLCRGVACFRFSSARVACFRFSSAGEWSVSVSALRCGPLSPVLPHPYSEDSCDFHSFVPSISTGHEHREDTKAPKPVRNGAREHIGAISILRIFVHPADSPETHANKEAFQKLGFSCSR